MLSREHPQGIASDALLKRVDDYLQRDDIAQESDEITTKSAAPKLYRIVATVYARHLIQVRMLIKPKPNTLHGH